MIARSFSCMEIGNRGHTRYSNISNWNIKIITKQKTTKFEEFNQIFKDILQFME